MTRAHDLVFIGPSAEVLERFASKAGTRQLLAAHGLPVVPGSEGMLRDDEHALAEAERIGYPLLIKPSAGGGGKGMRLARTARELQQALTVCRSEARAAFGDDSLYLEKWLERTRHVEVQVIIDNYGHGVHVGERDCSVQRRHQKIVEEAPSPAIDDATRTELAESAIRAALAAGLPQRRHAGVPRRRRGPLLLHRDQRPHPGRAPGHGDALRHRHRGRADPPGCRRAPRLRPGGRAPAWPRHRVPHQRRGRARRLPAPGRDGGALRAARWRRASAWRRTSTAATRSRRTTIRCSASSSSGDPTARAPWRARGWPSRSCWWMGWRPTSRSIGPSSRTRRSSRVASTRTCSTARVRRPSWTPRPAPREA